MLQANEFYSYEYSNVIVFKMHSALKMVSDPMNIQSICCQYLKLARN